MFKSSRIFSHNKFDTLSTFIASAILTHNSEGLISSLPKAIKFLNGYK
ncbi:hypothetical protein RPATATE_0995 [Rickettsia parkeri str. Tate's Hell]|uniref:Uncharacterized protein n=1 Tax=Rickettsia parkeri str. Tate's Hell TaxID=1359189 RepID=A0ABR5DRJ8_RICPA|nr:hypothetical protein RPAAT24_1528 [Rickettsia parkeri str. AT\